MKGSIAMLIHKSKIALVILAICAAQMVCAAPPVFAQAQGAPNPGAAPAVKAGNNPELVQLMAQCFAEAIEKTTARQDGNTIEFACYGKNASALFEKLARFDREELSTYKTGKYITRNFYDGSDKLMPDYCWQKVIGADGTPATGFGCQLYYVAGRILGN